MNANPQTYCSSCGAALTPSAGFCASCGSSTRYPTGKRAQRTRADKLESTGAQMRELGKLINGIVWGSVFIAVIGFLIYSSLT